MEKKVSEMYYDLGISQIKKESISQAIPLLKKVVVFDKDNSHGWNLLGLCFYQLGQFSKAEQSWLTSMQINSQDNPAQNYIEHIKDKSFEQIVSLSNAAIDLISQGEYRKAIKLLEQKKMTDCNITLFYNVLGLSYVGLGQKQKALTAWGKTLKVDRENPQALKYIREILGNEKAISFLEKIKIKIRIGCGGQ